MNNLLDLNLNNKNLIIRVDMNVPIKDGDVYDRTRILASMPTVNHALEQGAKVLLVSHLGRPEEGIFDEKLSLRPVVECLKDIVKEEEKTKNCTIYFECFL